jgi:hypothetical protein
MLDRFVALLGRLPTTQARVAVTLLIALGTAVRYWVGGWEPSLEWLSFLTLYAGLDVAQFTAKRVTHKPEIASGAVTGK